MVQGGFNLNTIMVQSVLNVLEHVDKIWMLGVEPCAEKKYNALARGFVKLLRLWKYSKKQTMNLINVCRHLKSLGICLELAYYQL